ncbi:hypothetical protein RFM99_26380 [Mesorhizobium sp. VK4C]|uniref:hypothetical protein n=1 Tax=Mesorhizobium captivum TaxID=3072319 RepID=UPI002A242E4F|nr:hypothetical protein [Mesorhizobium sp. VK4C]MDX8501927.1 hypothetical protein [Mesorhizobium sp. VK4C]
MALLTPIIHCLIDAEPTSFHADDVGGKTVTFAANLCFEVPTDSPNAVAIEEASARALLGNTLTKLDYVEFHVYQLNFPKEKGDPYTLTLADEMLVEKISAPDLEAKDGYVFDWLDKQKSGQSRYWTSLAREFDPGLTEDASAAGAAPRLRAAQVWNAPAGHRQGLTHLLRLKPSCNDATYIVLPFRGDPGDEVPDQVDVTQPDAGNWRETIVECTYDVLGGLGTWRCQTNPIGSAGGEPITYPPPPSGPLREALTSEGFLVVNKDAEAIRRFLKSFEERAASIMTAANALHVDGKEDAEGLEEILGFKITLVAPPIRKAVKLTYHWGPTVWYVVSRLVAALDNHVLALLKPVANGESWMPSPKSEGDVLAPLVSAILQEAEDLQIASDLDGPAIAKAVRYVLQQHCPLVATGPQEQLVPALRYVYELAEPKTITTADKQLVLDPPDPANLVSSMLAQYQKGGNYDNVPSEAVQAFTLLLKKSIEVLSAALNDLEQPLFEEAGAERALIRLFETVELDIANPGKPTAQERLTYRIATAIAAGPPTDSLQTAVASAWARYKSLLEGPFNGAEAIRRAVSASFTDALLKSASVVKEKLDAGRLRGLTAAARFYKWRLAGKMNKPNCFQIMAMPLGGPDPKYRPKTVGLLERFDDAYRRAVAPLVTPPAEAERFTPDSFPQPLPIQIASGIDGGEIDDFAKAFNGICVAVRRLDDKNSRWAYANLADLRWGPEQKNANGEMEVPKKASAVLHPMLPASADGRGPMFIDYEGFPFADAAGAERFSDDVSPGAQKLFYQHEPHEDYKGSTFEKLPRLAYGRKFYSFGFAVSNAGVLPRALQKETTQPWLPYSQIERLFDGNWTEPDLFETVYQRRTAIARMAVIEQPAPGTARRLGESIPGVQPLCADYPRLGVVADTSLVGVIDLFRDSDGAPRIRLPEKIERPIEWRVDEFEWIGDPSALTLRLFDRMPQGPGTPGAFWTTINAGLKTLRGLRLVAEDLVDIRKLRILSGDTPYAEFDLDLAAASYWLRLELATDAAKPASLSFADPEGRRPAGDDAPLVLLRPDDKTSTTWLMDLPRHITVRVSSPRVGYLNYMRWMANSTLRKEAYTTGADAFEEILLIAYLMRHLDARLAQQLDNLPDPAVDEIRLELLTTDRLTGSGGVADPNAFDLRTRLSDFAATVPGIVAALRKEFPKPPLWTPERLIERIFKPLDDKFSFEVAMTEGAFGLGGNVKVEPVAFKAEVPSGSVAQLSLHAHVPARHFCCHDGHPAVLHPGLKQSAMRETSDGLLFCYPAASIRIETMYDGIDAGPKADITKWIEAAAAMIEAAPVPNARRFDIKTFDSVPMGVDRSDWRLLGEIDVTTQRWRVSGRPIYNFIQPRSYARNENAMAGPALPINFGARDHSVEQFESEAFFDRPDLDAQTVTQRLAPLGSRTVLQQHSWDAPSATYFRHRFTLRSRYAGALQLRTKRSVDAWQTRAKLLRKEHGWTMRVAMLADASRLILTRPQLRALIPLTTVPGGESAALPAPPVAAILQEPPYSRGGLADRIAPEITTGFGYGFEEPKTKAEDPPPVEILDSRKEAGPNPQLNYRAFDERTVLDPNQRREGLLGLSLRGEGPLGLTFDTPDAPAPAFANTMLSLRPLSLSGPEPPLEEAMMAVTMRRYLDPAWLSGPDALSQDKPVLTADRTWWIELAQESRPPVKLSFVRPDGVQIEIAEIVAGTGKDDGHLVVSAWKKAIDKIKGYKDVTVKVAKVESRHIGALAILHQPIAAGRYSTSILTTLQSVRVADGESGLPLMLASFEWSGPEAPKNRGKDRKGDGQMPPPDPGRLVISGAKCTVRETMASATTSLRWTQISRDFDLVHVVGRDGEDDRPLGKPHLARDFVARVAADNKLTFDLIKGAANVAVCASTLGNPYPVHVHRHTGFITTRYLAELGRPVEVFCRKALAGGQATVLPGDPGDGEQAVRVVEFETPASVICDKDLRAVPPAYLSGYFDLVSTGYQDKGDILLTIRFVGSVEHLKQFKTLTVLLSQPDQGAPLEIPIDLTKAKTAAAIGARLILRPSVDEKAAWLEAWTVHADGTQVRSADPKKMEPRLKLSNVYPGFLLQLKTDRVAAGSSAEFWTDVSLLHGAQGSIPNAVTATLANEPPPGPTLDFDFDWLFSARQDGEAPALVSPAKLSGMTEAQARIISVSPPISIV